MANWNEGEVNFNPKVSLIVPAQEIEGDERYGWIANFIQGGSYTVSQIIERGKQSWGIGRFTPEQVLQSLQLMFDEGMIEVKFTPEQVLQSLQRMFDEGMIEVN